jgi:hypothetical protein
MSRQLIKDKQRNVLHQQSIFWRQALVCFLFSLFKEVKKSLKERPQQVYATCRDKPN